jgi:TM2 domain-containing membrane protein YozV
MATRMIQCSACRNEVSGAAEACPKCGHPINPKPKWNAGIAMLLSFFIPGLGQVYKGQVFSGIFWFVATAIGYLFFVIPGICLHLMAFLGAGLGDPRK